VANGNEIPFSPKEFKLLALLAQNSGVVFETERLFQTIWNADSFGDYRTLAVHISNIRKKVEKKR